MESRIEPWLKAQFGYPSGFWGRVAGTIMAHRASNRERARWTVGLLAIRDEDRVLEIGFGPGVAIEFASQAATDVFVAGVDRSEVMLRQSRRRHARAIAEGRVDLRLASVERLPSFGARFNKIFTINSIGFWDDPVARLESLRELLVPGGTIAVTVQPRGRAAGLESVKRTEARLVELLTLAGFRGVHRELLPLQPVAVVAALGTR